MLPALPTKEKSPGSNLGWERTIQPSYCRLGVRQYTFNIPGITPSQNELDGRHWRVKHGYKVEWHELVGYVVGKCREKPTKARVSIVRVARMLIDDLNVPAGCKWLLDAFVELGWLVDDSREWCRVRPISERRRRTRRSTWRLR